ncbi:hypothetical protein [Acinetobacter sp. YH12251]|uniref:hypothetical protein n=1 Tax=Acinetobacter sp. YH12251 TaxID=2601176 RepID=UPI0015D15482|nr:hypothetical protein [Acinetobacter sp. YH12251]
MYPKTIYKKNIYKTTLCALMLLTSAAYAEIATEAIQTPDRQTVAIGDSIDLMRSRMQASPMKMVSYPLQEKNLPAKLAVDYTYEISNMRYVITIVDDQVKNIKTENLDGLKQ